MPHDQEHALDSLDHTGTISDTQHGTRGGGTLHPAVTGAVDGFMAAADKTKLDASGVLASTTPANVTKAAAAVGVGTTTARADHKHDITTAAPSSVGTANTEGAATSLARSDHVHNHGSQSTATHHAAATTGANGFMSSADKTKLDGIIFGSQRQSAASEAESFYSGDQTWQQKLRMTTPSLPAGTYRIGWFYEAQLSNASNSYGVRTQINDTVTMHDEIREPKDTTNWTGCGGFYNHTIVTPTVLNIDLDYKAYTNLYAVGIRRARLEVWRVV